MCGAPIASGHVQIGEEPEGVTTKLVEGVDFYREGDKVVLKAAYHLKRGYCCNSRCRHCPYKPGSPKPTIELLGLDAPTGGNER